MNRIIFLFGFIATLITFTPISTVSKNSTLCARSVTEYLLPSAKQTHEVLYIQGKNMLLITQFSNSQLLKAKTAPDGEITSVKAYLIGNSTSGLHGLILSTAYSAKVWVSLEIGNELLLLDPKSSHINATPQIIKTITIPEPGNGPHHIAEYGINIWATLKVSEHVLRINHHNPTDYKLYKAQPTPVFLAQHPVSNEIYASEYKSNTILRIDPTKNTMSRIEIPSSVGESPVGLVAGENFIWVALLSIKSRGTGSFGKIFENGTIKWYTLKTAIGRKAALLHIAVDPDENTEPRPGLWFLASSVEDPQAFDMIIRTHFDKNFDNFQREEIAFLPSQGVKAHRFAVSRPGIYVTELTSSRIAFYTRARSTMCDFTFQTVKVDERDEI